VRKIRRFAYYLLLYSCSLVAREKPSLEAIWIDEPMKIEGLLDEAAWATAPVGSIVKSLPTGDRKGSPLQAAGGRAVFAGANTFLPQVTDSSINYGLK
jgi:hypothetical protein